MTDTSAHRPRVTATGLEVEGKPFTVLGAEIHNSSSSTSEAISRSFARVRELGANTVLAPVAWDLFEPEENVFDTTLVLAMLEAASAHDLRLIPLWFGSWKNGQSSYVPAWVKQDGARFTRAESTRGRLEHLSPFCLQSRSADAHAFAQLMACLATADTRGTVVMVQVENEVGLLGDSRDCSPLADAAWESAVPVSVVAAIADAPGTPVHADWLDRGSPSQGSWAELFGDTLQAHEAFMAHAYAGYIETVAAAGRQEHDVPLFVNAWLDNSVEDSLTPVPAEGAPVPDDSAEDDSDVAFAGGAVPGSFPSGGPLPRVASIWRSLAPTVDILAPDYYFGDADGIFRAFASAGGHLLIPEMRRSALGVGHMFLALGEHGAIGVSPFGVDSIERDGADEPSLADGYALLAHAVSLRDESPSNETWAFLLTEERHEASFTLGSYVVTVTSKDRFGLFEPAWPAYGMLIHESDGRLIAVGRGFTLSFSVADRDGVTAGILSADELRREASGETVVSRRWNGDETASGHAVRLPPLTPAAPKSFPIPLMSTSTGVVRVRLYTY
ncbi:glycosyl hydrolase family 35 [Rathayibacter sp. PhB152]|uniref:DUF5597 domain-containing protein n=1 Tax=Rathayibacter sp. PhB152 TaxID=2485190 RepID=UPI000F4CD1F0|nr:DUF5597 domain-containing protein [Rathayibacter sp. PhB152]ROQ60406.1 glycosyl hydrolase family 35 [Rathayibacter sp. PhB152]